MRGSRLLMLTGGLAACLMAAAPGCGSSEPVSEVQPSQAAIDADELGRKAMQEYMQGKTKSPAKTKEKPAEGGSGSPPK